MESKEVCVFGSCEEGAIFHNADEREHTDSKAFFHDYQSICKRILITLSKSSSWRKLLCSFMNSIQNECFVHYLLARYSLSFSSLENLYVQYGKKLQLLVCLHYLIPALSSTICSVVLPLYVNTCSIIFQERTEALKLLIKKVKLICLEKKLPKNIYMQKRVPLNVQPSSNEQQSKCVTLKVQPSSNKPQPKHIPLAVQPSNNEPQPKFVQLKVQPKHVPLKVQPSSNESQPKHVPLKVQPSSDEPQPKSVPLKVQPSSYEPQPKRVPLKVQPSCEQLPSIPSNDFRTISIFPTIKNIEEPASHLQPIITVGSYANVEQYLDIQFRLLHEDFVGSLRRSIKSYFKLRKMKGTLNVKKAKVYQHVKIVNHKLQNGLLVYLAKLSDQDLDLVSEDKNRFKPGSLICLSSDGFKTILFAIVVYTSDALLSNGLVYVKLQDNMGLYTFDKTKNYLLLESAAYFEAYRHNLSVLHGMTNSSFPMKKYIVSVQKEIELPRYLNKSSLYDISPLLEPLCYPECKGEHMSKLNTVKVLEPETWPSGEELDLDESQYEALQAALRKELAIIQGPPGTGKTYVGLRIMQLLVHNRSLRRECPILVVCYTNHALDQFLEGILQFNKNIVRIGNRSESEKVLKYSIRNLRSKYIREKRFPYDIVMSFRSQKFHVRRLNKIMSGIVEQHKNSFKFLFNESTLKCVMSTRHYNSLRTRVNPYGRGIEIIAEWLGVSPKLVLDRSTEKTKKWKTPKIKTEAKLLEDKLQQNDSMSSATAKEIKNVWELQNHDRWRLYRFWRNELIGQKHEDMIQLQEQYLKESQALREIERKQDLILLRSTFVVGMTTTGAAKHHKLLQELSPEVVVVEEAAEVLESHIVTALAASTKHLILIGDHQQLKPHVSLHDLDTKYNLSLSLFERMVKNGLEYHQLAVQHRMRPVIASLITPLIYPILENHKLVLNMENVRGVGKNMFFVTHNMPETLSEDSESKLNVHEAEFLVGLCKYFLQQGFDSSKITILAAYTAQVSTIVNIIDQAENRVCENVLVSTIDSYQGEENDIVLVSFVRSNTDDEIGFLKVSNRVCVALSRAKKGLFCIGNFLLYARVSDLWEAILGTLRQNNALGTSMCYFP